jgi:hypothetical protein
MMTYRTSITRWREILLVGALGAARLAALQAADANVAVKRAGSTSPVGVKQLFSFMGLLLRKG